MSLLLLLAGAAAGTSAPPTGLFLVPFDSGQYLRWVASTNAVAYKVYYSRGRELIDPVSVLVPATGADKMLTGLLNWQDYTFAVSTIYAGPVESALCAPVIGQPGALPLHQFGVMVSGINYPYTTFALRGSIYRQATGVKLSETTLENEVAAVQIIADNLQYPMRYWLTCRWDGGGGAPDSGPIGAAELATWSANLATYAGRYGPDAIAVLNEEPSVTFSTLTSAQYLAALEAAYDVLHPLGIVVTNGGVVWGGAAACYWDYLFNNVGLPEAAAFASIAFNEPERTLLMECVDESTLPAEYLTVISKNKDWLYNVYAPTKKMDYVNVHVHWPASSDGMPAVQAVLEWYAETSGKLVTSNESNTTALDSALLLEQIDLYRWLNMPMALQYSINSGHSHALQDTDGALLPEGEAWRDAMLGQDVDVMALTLAEASSGLTLVEVNSGLTLAEASSGLTLAR